MSFLDDAQLRELSAYVQAQAGRYQPLQDELLDHLACLVEEKMAGGLDFTTAKAQALAYFSKDEVKKTEGRTLYFVHTKPVLMKVFSLLSFTCFLSLAAWLSSGKEKTTIPAQPESHPVAMLVSVTDPPDIAPLDGKQSITAEYGPRMHPIFKKEMLHQGVDFKAPAGTPILATADGTVIFAKEEKFYGLKVIIQHDDHYESLYAHMSSIKVKAGEHIKKGTVIGLVGNSGASTAPHLHYEVLKDGQPVNPADYLPKT